MYFKRLELHGFKSFAEPVLIEFDRGITCVVGPNGSGKSNICDAIRWVLGAQSAKMLRGDKMEDVIFSGTATRKPRGMAEVTLVIDNEQGELPLDYNEIAITRRMYRSGESEYLINNHQCRMKDIRALIMDTGIGVEGYSIIGQGKISDIISNNTESIREILEETAGIVMYRSKKAEAERKLSSATDNMERVTDIIGEIQGRLGKLEEESQKARTYLELKETHRELEINITLRNIETTQSKQKEIGEDLIALEKSLEESRTKGALLAEEISKGTAKRDAMDVSIEQERAKQLALYEQINALTSKDEVNRERMSAIVAGHQRLTEEIEVLSQKIAAEKESSSDLFKEKDAVTVQLDQLTSALGEKMKVYVGQNKELSRQVQEIDEQKNKIFGLQSKISGKKAEIASISALKDTLEKRKEQILHERETGGGGESALAQELEQRQQKQALLHQELYALKQEKNLQKQQFSERFQQERELGKELEQLQVNVGQLSARKKTFEEMEGNYDGYNHGVKFIMKENLPGINGVVTELITVPSGFELAMETALGGNIQNIICEGDQVAKAAIKRLKESKAGRLTFMPLDSIRPKKVKTGDNLEQEPGFCGYGLDCVSFEEKYRPAMEFLLGNVVVTQDMDAAVKLYKKLDGGFKIVTLEGEIISDRGTITGGKYKNKSANILERRAEIAALEETLADKITKQKSVEARRKELQETLETMQEAISNTDEEILAKEKGIFAEENEINRIKTARTEAGNKEEKWQRELEQIDIEQETSQQSKEALSDEVWAMENEIRLVERQTMENTTAYSDKKREVDALYEEITKERIAVSGCESEKAKIDAVVEKVNEAIAGFEKDKAEKERQLETQKEEKEKLVFGAGETTAIIKENQEKKALLDAQLEALYQEKTQLIQRIEGVAQKKEETDKITASFQNQKYELEVRSAKQETQLENAKAKLWEEFEVSYLQALEFKLEEFDFQQAVRKSRELKARLRDLGEVNIGAIKEFETVGERYSFLTAQREDIFVSMKELQGIIGDMDKVIRIKFKESFEQVVENFEAVFQDLYGGGHAKITFSNEENPFESEIEITAQPPGKQLKHINLMSGGEKTMTAIALMFAVLKTKPTPCCILDEIEAALDDSNLEIFGKYVERFAGVQFTLITHQKSTMEHADVMYGVTMPESGISKVYSLKMGEQPVM